MLQQSVSLTKNDLIIRDFFFVSSKAAKTRDFGALFGGKEAWQHKTNLGHLLLMFVCHTKCSSILAAALTLAVIDIAYCSAQLCHILISNRCETNQCHLYSLLRSAWSLTTKNRQISHFHINHHCQQLNKSKNGHFSLASLNALAN